MAKVGARGLKSNVVGVQPGMLSTLMERDERAATTNIIIKRLFILMFPAS